MSIIENTKEIAELIKKIGNVELYKRIVELEGEIIDLSREKHQGEIKLHDLEKRFTEEKSMEFRKPFIYRKDDPLPHCPKCWEADRKGIHLDGPMREQSGNSYYCHQCKETFFT
jgi:hypothetical protein